MRDRYIGSSTDALIAAMETLGDAEETQVIILTRDSNGNCGMISNCNYYSDRIGILQSQLFWEQAAMVKTEIEQ